MFLGHIFDPEPRLFHIFGMTSSNFWATFDIWRHVCFTHIPKNGHRFCSVPRAPRLFATFALLVVTPTGWLREISPNAHGIFPKTETMACDHLGIGQPAGPCKDLFSCVTLVNWTSSSIPKQLIWKSLGWYLIIYIYIWWYRNTWWNTWHAPKIHQERTPNKQIYKSTMVSSGRGPGHGLLKTTKVFYEVNRFGFA